MGSNKLACAVIRSAGINNQVMVPQPSRTLDLERKEELIIQKQIRQATARMSSKQNLPTLIGKFK